MRIRLFLMVLMLSLVGIQSGLPVRSGWTQVEDSSAIEKTQPGKVSLEIKGMDILDLLKLLSTETGVSIVAGRNVTGRVTVFLKNVDPQDALEIILAANGLAYDRRGGILYVMTEVEYSQLYGERFRDQRILRTLSLKYAKPDAVSRTLEQIKSTIGRIVVDEGSKTLILLDTPETVQRMEATVAALDLPIKTQVFELNYAVSETLLPKIQEMLTKGVGEARIDDRTNKLVVRDYPEKMEAIAQLIHAFDERSQQVLIEAAILQIIHKNESKLGMDWEAMLADKVKLKSSFPLTTGGKLTVATVALQQAGDYSFIVHAAEVLGRTKILSSPKITVVNNQEAKILIGSKEAYVTTTVSQTGTGTAVTAEQVNFIDVGVKLFVTPTISREGFVSMKIRPEISSKTTPIKTSQGNEIPIVETSEAETTVQVKDGNTVIIAGLMKNEKSKDVSGLPFLSRMPILGILFRSTSESDKQTELVILLTPRIVTGELPPTSGGNGVEK